MQKNCFILRIEKASKSLLLSYFDHIRDVAVQFNRLKNVEHYIPIKVEISVPMGGASMLDSNIPPLLILFPYTP